MWHNVHSQQRTYVSSSYRSNRLGLSHWDPYAVCRGGCLELYYCDMVEVVLVGFKPDLWRPTGFPSVLWHCWVGHLACKNRPRNDLLCGEWDVKPYTLTHSLWAIVEGFFGHISPNLNGPAWNPEYKWGVTLRTHIKIQGKLSQGLHLMMQKRVLFLVTNTPRTFGHLSCTNFDRFWNKDVNQCPHAYTGEKFRISAQEILQFHKTAKIGTFEGVFVIRLQLKRHNFGQWE